MSIIPENNYKKIEYIAFSFVYSYNKNEMKVYNAMLNISSNGYIAEETSSDSTTTEEETNTETEEEDNYIDYIILVYKLKKSMNNKTYK